MYVLALSDYKQLAAAAGYKPAPQIRQINCSLYISLNTILPIRFVIVPFFLFIALALHYLYIR